MPDMYFDVDTAITECPVNVMPLLDDTDFKTIEGAVAYNAAGMALYWHFVTSAGVYNNGVAVTPTTAGDYDWTDHGTHGIYTIEIPASGGASINNDTEGYGWFTGVATGVLPWRGPVIGFRAAALNDALCDGGDNLDVNTVQWLGTACATPTVAGVPEVDVTHIGGDAQSGTDLKDFADAGYDPATNKVQGVVLVDTLTTYTGNTVQTGDSFARIGATGSGLTSLASQASVTTIDDLLDTEMPALTTAVATLQTSVDDLPTNAELATALGTADDAVLAAIAASDAKIDIIDTVVDSVKAKTDSLTFTVAGVVDANIQRINDVTITGNGQVGTEFNV